ncbi:carboxypeptidase-like regulatory domain-containing protein [uncultured Butyricimonas sp.]|uniref:carboxypeptidase regulatory-like domain-containing protein n=1 Tax=uncultured Butyricimonas sp. TaxID=1268785 RepID=UPI0026DC25C3|nr:carboxypeptidase-like regulatory domain-containing protein [uncultured Butyricimonas sp.]
MLSFKIIGLFSILFISIISYAQDTRITITGQNISIKQTFEQIEAQSKYTVAYSQAKLDDRKKITVDIKNTGIQKVLEQILKNTGLTYKIKGWHIIIVPLSPVPRKDIPGQTIKGVVKDAASGAPVPNANVILCHVNPPVGTTTDSLGNFRFKNIPVGRYDIQVSCLGYEPVMIKEILLTSAKEVYREIFLSENTQDLEEVVVRASINKEHTLNPMALAGGRMISVEEANRYAGGLDDPARLATSFAGVARAPGSNAIAIRGNSPQFLQWKLEGVEIPNPTHFADMAGIGGGLFSGLSSQVMGNSDFFNGAFPAEYNNALSGVFDMSVKNGNNEQHEHAVQIGFLGLDIASEGPINKKSGSSYIFNYRFFSTALMGGLAANTGINFQDLTFKLNFPTRGVGTFSVWGIGLLDMNKVDAEENRSKWETYDDRQKIKMTMTKGAGGITHRYAPGNDAYFKTSLAATYSDNHPRVKQLTSRDALTYFPVVNMKSANLDIVFNSYFNKKYSSGHTNRTGITVTGLLYDLNFNLSPNFGLNKPMERIVKGKGEAMVISVYSNSILKLTDKLTTNVGINAQMFTLSSKWTIEPRLAFKWDFNSKQALSVAYGLHSRREKLDYYFVQTPQTGDDKVNKELDFAKAHHFVLTYDWGISENIHLKIEPYYQALFDVPVEPETSFSIINHDSYYMDRQLVNKGKGHNYGVDITLERYLNKGYYYLFTGSVFKSEYLGGDHVWRNTRLDRGYIFNALGGKEWMVGQKQENIFNLNFRMSYQGGDRYTPVDETKSLAEKDITYDETRAFSRQFAPAFTVDLGISYKLNKKHVSHEIGLQLLNLTGYTGQHGLQYNEPKNMIEKKRVSDILPNLSYKILF